MVGEVAGDAIREVVRNVAGEAVGRRGGRVSKVPIIYISAHRYIIYGGGVMLPRGWVWADCNPTAWELYHGLEDNSRKA